MRVLFLDCISGISGDMLLAALADAGWQHEQIHALPGRLGLQGVTIHVEKRMRCGIKATGINVTASQDQPMRTMHAIESILQDASIPATVKEDSIDILGKLADVEADIHGCSRDEVHFHEIGAVDTIIDIVGVLTALDDLGIKKVFCSDIPLSRGFIQCSHGIMPLPAPAVTELLRGVPVRFVEEQNEIVTPTGAAILCHVVEFFGYPPAMRLLKTGYGAGSRDLESIPNILRIMVGDTDRERCPEGWKQEKISELRTVMDDITPEQLGYMMQILLEKGAIDTWITNIHMKKNRPGFELTVLCRPGVEDSMAKCIFLQGSTTGIRFYSTSRFLIHREPIMISTRWGAVKAKLIIRPDGRREIAPEFEECRKIAEKSGIPIRSVYSEVARFITS